MRLTEKIDKNIYTGNPLESHLIVNKLGQLEDIEEELGQKCCLASIELYEYLGNNISGYTKVGYAWHISNLEIFDKPKELSEFCKWNNPRFPYFLTKAPQSWCYVEVE